MDRMITIRIRIMKCGLWFFNRLGPFWPGYEYFKSYGSRYINGVKFHPASKWKKNIFIGCCK